MQSDCGTAEASGAPIRLVVDLWPLQARAKATFSKDGKATEFTLSSVYIQMILAALKSAGKI